METPNAVLRLARARFSRAAQPGTARLLVRAAIADVPLWIAAVVASGRPRITGEEGHQNRGNECKPDTLSHHIPTAIRCVATPSHAGRQGCFAAVPIMALRHTCTLERHIRYALPSPRTGSYRTLAERNEIAPGAPRHDNV
jgi:hypothetical protein